MCILKDAQTRINMEGFNSNNTNELSGKPIAETNDPDNNNDNLKILYITFAIVIGLLLLWIIIVTVTKDDPFNILSEMKNLSKQIPPVSDSY